MSKDNISLSQTLLQKRIGIYGKLWAIQNEVKKIVKSEENKFQNYYFFNELQVLKLLKPLLEKYQIAIFLTDDSKEPLFCEQKGNIYLVKYLKRLDIVDTEEKNEETDNKLTYNFWAIGTNQDPAKAKGAAETYAVKYLLTKFFLIPVRNTNDPDYEGDKLETREQEIAKKFLEKHDWYSKKG